MQLRKVIPTLAAGLIFIMLAPTLMAAEYVDVERTAPTRAAEVGSRLEDILSPRAWDDRVVFEDFRKWKKRQPAFTRDSYLQFKLRAYDIGTDLGEGRMSTSAIGGDLSYRSGAWRDFLSVGASWYGSFGMRGPEDRDFSGLLRSDGEDLSVLGQAYLQLKKDNTGARLYRQTLNMPYINRSDSRMIPNTHEAYMVGRQNTAVQFVAGHVTKIKLKNSDEFVHMAEAAGAEGARGGTTVLGGYFSFMDQKLDIGAVTQHTKDVFNTTYGELNWTAAIGKHVDYKFTGQYTRQWDVGDALLGQFKTHAWGVRGVTSYRDLVLTLAYTETGNGARIRSPFGGRPTFSSLMIQSFQRAGERALIFGLSYNLEAIGMPAFGGSANFAWGRDAMDSEGVSMPSTEEADLTLDYRPTKGPLAGVWLRFRYAFVHEDGLGQTEDQIRVILNYELPVL